ncbi:MAG: ComEA family DNA-binding protein [Myxococcota bacterium]
MIAWVAVAALGGDRIDLNHAGADVLDALPTLGPAKAAAVVAWRSEHGPCSTVDDLLSVPGIGLATVAVIRDLVFCGHVAGDRTGAGLVDGSVIDVNRASPIELQRLPGVFPARAEAIVAERDRGGPFATCADLSRVAGIGPATIANLGPGGVARP